MAGKPLPGHPGVTVYPAGEMPAHSYVLKNKDGSLFTDVDGNTYAGREPSLLDKAMPWIVGGMMGYGALSAAGVFSGSAAAGAGSAPGIGTVSTTAASSAAVPSVSGVMAAAPVAAPAAAAATGGIGTVATAALGGKDYLNAAIFGGQTIANLWGAKQSANASDRATAAQLQASREALDFLKQQWTTQQKQAEPFLTGQTPAAQALSRQSILPMPASVVARIGQPIAPPTMSSFGQPNALIGSGAASVVGSWQPVPATPPGRTVRMIAPDGVETFDVPAEQVNHWLSKQATLAPRAVV